MAFDLTDEAEVTAVVPSSSSSYGRLDILVNNAGICIWTPFLESSLELAPDDGHQPHRRVSPRPGSGTPDGGSAGGESSTRLVCLVIGRERLTAYVASKHGLAGLTKSLAGELGRHNVTCNAIAPGSFITEMAEPSPRTRRA